MSSKWLIFLPVALFALFAQVTDGVVTDVRVTSAEFMAENPDRYKGEWIETFMDVAGKTYAGIGYLWNGTDFVAPVVEPPVF